jgi:phospholipid/cholesterol/gamma-HCH transport system substrate-binding protein
MKVKFNRFEKVAGLFVGVAILGFLFATLGVAIKKGWFSSKVGFTTTMATADGIHPGTLVQISGLRAGSVDEIELVSASEVKVRFYVLDKFAHQIRKDSLVQVFRPFIIGEKVLEITVGDQAQPILAAKSEIPLQATFDIMDLVSGRKMNSFVSSFDHMADSLKIFAEALADPERSRALVSMVDHMVPLIKNLTKVTDVALKDKRLEMTLSNLKDMTDTMNKILPQLAEEAPDLGKQMAQVVENLNILTSEFKKLTPAIAEIAPDLPHTTRRAVEALDETVVTLKAIQRSWFLRSNVKDIRQEEEKRMPAETK